MSGAALEVEDLYVSYGLSQALFGVDISVDAGRVLAILGRNGAGKSTFGRAVSGLVPVAHGHVRFDGAEITGKAAHRIRKAGLTYIPEGRGIFPGLSVIDNLKMATRQAGGRTERQEAIDRAITLFPVLGASSGRAASQVGSNRCLPWRGRSLSSPSSSLPTRCRSASRRSWWTRSSRASSGSGLMGSRSSSSNSSSTGHWRSLTIV